MAILDFDGDYGRTYRRTIRGSIPGYDTLLEIGAAALAAAVPDAAAALVVGPGPGEELDSLLSALPDAHFTLLEPSEAMLAACADQIARAGASGRCTLRAEALGPETSLGGQRFGAVVCHHVLHLMPAPRQRELLIQLAGLVAPGGALVLSSYSEPSEAAALEMVLSISRTRLERLGVDHEVVEKLLASRNSVVFSLDAATLTGALAEAGLEPPLPLLQALASRLWISRCRATERG